jgi:hypothetical protein
LHDRKTRNHLKAQRREKLRPGLGEAKPPDDILDRPLILVRRENGDNEPLGRAGLSPLGRAVDASIIKVAEEL